MCKYRAIASSFNLLCPYQCPLFPYSHTITSICLVTDPHASVFKLLQADDYLTTNFPEVEVTLRLISSQSVSLGVEPTLGLVTRYYFLSEGYCLKVEVFFLWGPPL
jgi:hypothetical protein